MAIFQFEMERKEFDYALYTDLPTKLWIDIGKVSRHN